MTAARRVARLTGWLALVAAIDLVARTFAYALSTSGDPLRARLSGEFGGPHLVALSLGAVGAAIAVSATVLWLADLGVRERWALAEPATRGPRPRLRLRRLLVRAVALWIVGMLVFTVVESYIHWRAGLGFHGLSCLLGPVHRDAIPIIGALALIGSAVVTALAHLLAWMRRVVARLTGRPARAARRRIHPPRRPLAVFVARTGFGEALRARPPPLVRQSC
jgi:hypothetical protein